MRGWLNDDDQRNCGEGVGLEIITVLTCMQRWARHVKIKPSEVSAGSDDEADSSQKTSFGGRFYSFS
jgi:hypothetical protein